MAIENEPPTIPEFYETGLLASAFAYLGILVLVSFSLSFDGASPAMFFTAFFWGGAVMAIPAVGIAFLITAPLGCLVGLALRRVMPPSQWLGAVTGAIVASAIVSIVLFPDALSQQILDPESLLFVTLVVAICAAAGWLAQRVLLDWRRAEDTFDPEQFE